MVLAEPSVAQLAVEVHNELPVPVRLVLVGSAGGDQDLGWLWPRHATEVVVTDGDLARRAQLEARARTGHVVAWVDSTELASGHVVLDDDDEPSAA